mmetsp:Transcript_30588/g.37105  ORF Transcript_30588/g.37105 Transcript_30588/m.37105 type:complete len:121 (-) Transcript_30588:471-833(-)
MVACNATYFPSIAINSACVPCSITLPRSITTILSAFIIVVKRCAIMIVVLFFFNKRSSNAACTSRSAWLSSADVASSNNKIGGSFTIALAIATRCFCPPDRSVLVAMSVSYPFGNCIMKL